MVTMRNISPLSWAASVVLLSSAAGAQEPPEPVSPDEADDAEWVPPTSPPPATPTTDEEIPSGTEVPGDRRGSMRTTEALGTGNVGISIGGGVAVLLPFYGFEVGVGVTDWLDVVGRFETVIGVFHYPHLGVRAQLPEIGGGWRIGTQLLANYSFFGIKTDQVNFTSTFYSSFEVGISGPVTDETDLVFGAGGEVDFFKVEVEDDEDRVDEAFAYDATVVRTALVSAFGSDFHGYAQLRVRIPTETFVFEAQELYIIPMLEIGGTWTF
jgi:hypothetical protein